MRTPILLLALGEIAISVTAIYVARIVLNGDTSPGVPGQNVTNILANATFAAVIFLSFLSMGLYQLHQRVEYLNLVARILVGLGISAVSLIVLFFMIPPLSLDFELLLASLILVLIPDLVLRYYFLANVDENVFRRNVLILGDGKRAASIEGLRRRADRRGYKIVGKVAVPNDFSDSQGNLIVRGRTLLEHAKAVQAEDIVIALDDRRGKLPIRELLDCKLHGIDVLDLLEFLERESGKIRADLVNPGWLIFSSGFRVSRLRRFLKRLLDLVVSSIALFFLWPIFLLVAICIKIEDGLTASVLYRQVRVGQNGENFRVIKFRSMRPDAEAAGGPVWADENDSRITRVGKFIRKFRIDEFPQFFNVLIGEMSIVGPRPERPEFVADLSEKIPYYDERHSVKPGVTGWAQLRYSYGSSEEDAMEKLHYDLYYVKNQGLILDIAIMIQTAEVVFWGKGAR